MGTGCTVPRPFPPTAQPLTDVTLIGVPDGEFEKPEWGLLTSDDDVRRLRTFTSDRWPGIVFHLSD
jgi:hypothetical protein